MRLRDDVRALEEPPFRWQFLAQSTSFLGDHIAPVALAFAVLDVEDSATAVGIVLLARMAPLLLVVLVGGVWADRLPRHRVMLTADGVRAATQLGLAALILAGHAQLWHFVALQVVNGVATAFFQPAATGLTPLTVSAGRLQQANALISLSTSAAVIVGPIVGGLLVATVGAAWGLVADGLTYVVSALCLARVRLPPRGAVARAPNMLGALREGWTEVRSRAWLMLGIGDLALFQVLLYSTYFVLGPVEAANRLGGAAAWGTIVTMWGFGAAIGGALALRYRPRHPLLAAVVAFSLVTPTMVVLGVSSSVAAVALTSVLAGAGMVFGSVLWDTTIQEEIPPDRLSRVAAYDWAGSMALRPIGYAAVGPIAAVIGAKWTLVISAAALLAVQAAVASTRAIRSVTRAGPAAARDPAPAAEAAARDPAPAASAIAPPAGGGSKA